MLVEHGMLSRHDVFVPVTVVGSVNLDAGEVYLTVRATDLQRLQGTEPAHVVFVEAQATE
jgi:hypothetical protein